MISPLISVIIPSYNSSEFIPETIDSILLQKDVSFEIIIIDDGSTDDTRQKVVADARIKYHYQANQGVSIARNNGLNLSLGEFIVFFDSDDKMAPDFLKTRLDLLLKKKSVNFVCGEVLNFNSECIEPEIKQGALKNDDILFYNPVVTTCPSNYMFFKQFLLEHKLKFNPKLSSTADRFFILQCLQCGNGELIRGTGRLYYRVSLNSMSNRLTLKLAADNELYYEFLIQFQLIPKNLSKQSLYVGYLILFKAYWKLRNLKKVLKFALLMLSRHPLFSKKL